MLTLGSSRFELVRRVGEGSSGVVYEARDLHTSSLVAIKVLHGGNELAEERFEREVAVLAELQHPAIVRYVAHGTAEDGRRYLVMEWLAGQTVEHYQRGAWSVEDVLALARRLVSGLAFASLRGVFHRDIKPANLFLVDGLVTNAKIVDFGLARRTSDRQRVTHTGFIVGTPVYMSPEQARGDPTIDSRTDVFSMGSLLYTCLCGREPFLAPQPLAVLAKICFDEPQPIAERAPHVPPQLRRLVEAMMRKERGERPSWRTISEELTQIADQYVPSEHERGRLLRTEALNIEPALSDTAMRRGATSLHRRGRIADQQRILAALFIGPLGTLPAEIDAELHAMTTRFGVRVERLVDGSRIVLPTQQLDASEQTVVAARCAIALRQLLAGRAPLVVCTGRAVIGEAQSLGKLFDRGAALLSTTPEGVVRVDEASASLLEARFELAGQEGTARTLERERSGGEAPRTLLGQPTPFLGRDRELQQLQLVFNECTDELVARVALVTAPAGGGKSRLRHELIERLRDDAPQFTLLVGRGDPMRGGTQFGVLAFAVHLWADLTASDPLEQKRSKLSARIAALVPPARAPVLAQFLGEMVGVPFPEQASPQLKAARLDHQLMADQMLASWLEWLEALSQREPVLFCVEDLHWSDPASLRFIEAALRSSRERALMVLALARPEVQEIFPQLWAERDLMVLRLAKLGTRACAKILEKLAGAGVAPALQTAIIERADGNPFFLEELVRALKTQQQDESLPETILAIVQARLDTLGDEPKLLIQAASIFGQTFRLVGVRALLGDDDSQFDYAGALAQLCDREMIFQSGPATEQEYVFRHALLRDAAYLLQPDEERMLGHRLAAAWLEHNAGAPALLADHYERGDERAQAAPWWARAAAQAFEVGSLDDALRCGERAIACGLEGELFSKLAALLAEARSYGEDDAGAAAWAERARASLPPGAADWWRATQVGAVAYLRRGGPELDVLAAQMVAQFSPDFALPEQALAVAYTVSECLRLMRDDIAERLLALLPSELPESLAGRPEGCLASARAVKSWRSGNLSEALRFGRVALEAQRRAGALRDVSDTLGLCGYFLHELGAYAEAELCLLEEVQLGQRIGSARDVSYGQLILGSIYARQSRLDEAERALREAFQGYQKLGVASLQAEALGHLAGVECARGDLERARQTIERALQLDGVDPAPRAYLLARLSGVALAAGLTSEALGHAQQARSLVCEHDLVEFVALVALSNIESLLAMGDHARVHSALEEAGHWVDVQATKIDEPARRRSFLDQVREHVRIRELMTSLLRASVAS